jgi:hypothetical protein
MQGTAMAEGTITATTISMPGTATMGVKGTTGDEGEAENANAVATAVLAP